VASASASRWTRWRCSSGRSHPLELCAVVAEADDHGARVDLAERLEQHVDALVVEELAEVDDRRPVALEERSEAFGVAVVGQTLVRVARVRWVAARLVEEAGERLVTRARPPLVDVHPWRHFVDALDVADDLLQHLTDMGGADVDGGCALERRVGPRGELVVPAQRVLELRPVRLDRVGRSDRRADRAPEQDVVAEDEVGRKLIAQRACVRLDPGVELGSRAVLEELDLVALVAVAHEDGQEPADIRPHELRPPEVVELRVRLLAEDGHVVTREAPLARQGAGVDVRPGPAEQVPVPEQDPRHDPILPIRAG